jgi:cytochrome c-type biogenesis protein CcmF
MWIELGHFSLALALGIALLLGTIPIIGSYKNNYRWMAVGMPAALTLFLLTTLSFACLMGGFIGHDFSVLLIAQHSNSQLPLPYRIAATWGSHEGSILLWSVILSGWTLAVACFSQSLSPILKARILSVLGLISAGFLLFTLLTSNPFERLIPAAADGRDLNPLLQDPGMVFHPPLLYMGYVGTSVAFAFAVAGLLGGRFDAAWARWARPWTTIAWCFLTLGIALGSFWAYYELGWGGWWFWDPVENASFMPWLVTTALIHCLAVTEKRGLFKSWTVLLALLAFSLSLLGTFLVRSGVLTSVHAFATDPSRGVFILIFLGVVIGGALMLYAWRAPMIRGSDQSYGLMSRESMLLANNILLLVALAAVLLGTLYPLILDILDQGKISVGPPYFDSVFYPLMAPLLFLMAVGPVTRWRSGSVAEVAIQLRWALGVTVMAAFIVPAVVGMITGGERVRPLVSLGLGLGFWIAASVVVTSLALLRGHDGRLSLERFRLHSLSVWGMHLAHFGIAVFVLGVTLVKSYESEKELRLSVGQSTEIAGYRVKFEGLQDTKGANYDAIRGRFSITNLPDQGSVFVMEPEKRVYRAGKQAMTEAAIHRTLTRDFYLSMGEPVGDQAWALRISVKPFINYIWIACILMAMGGFLAVADKRYRRTKSAAMELTSGMGDLVKPS